MSKLKCFRVGVIVGSTGVALVLVVILIVAGQRVQQISIPWGPTIVFQEEGSQEPQPLPQVDMEIEGQVTDIFDNPRKGVIVTIEEIKKYSETHEGGRYHFSNIPERNYITLEARYGEEKCSRRIQISTDTKIVEEITTENVKRKTRQVHDPLILENPNIRVEAYLCKKVKDHTPIGIFKEENPTISVDIGTLWCFVRVIGPLGHEKGKKTEITYFWYCNGELAHTYRQDVGFNPTQQGWRTHAYKNLYRLTGTWRLDIEAKHKQLARLYFETY